MNNREYSSAEELKSFLVKEGVDVDQYGKGEAKTIEDLYSEVSSGEAKLSVHEKTGKIIRTIRVLNIDVLHKDKVLYEKKQVFKDKNGNKTERERERYHLTVAVSEKLHPEEELIVGVKRAVKEELGIILSLDQLECEILETEEESRYSPSFPGIGSIYKIFSTSIELDDDQYNSDGYIERQDSKDTYFAWK